ncbi:hypothetical protein QBC35DRAFT_22360 [Podospora australis]|uniref:Uncharacterized protein n=1 Tax=Podospora australis TaxID=1536484 RepID=A0AAN6WRQ6_9PEZI|nr:hypothetical protein QBC35DRAFT_22360 [Podospora australis]
MSGRNRPPVACVEDADESGNIYEGSVRYAKSVAPSSPPKERPNTGRVRREKSRKSESSPLTSTLNTDSDTTVHPRRDVLKKSSSQRDKSVGASKKALQMASRPAMKPAKTAPAYPKRDDAAYYGVDPANIAPANSNSRPRARSVRPSSYYGAPGSKPPSANAKFYQSQTPGPQMPSSFPPPPPQWGGLPPGPPVPHGLPPPPVGLPIPYPQAPSPMVMQGPPPDYFSRPLESRFGSFGSGSFGSLPRPMSAMAHRPPRQLEYEEDYEESPPDRTLVRRPSTNRKLSKRDEDTRAMPPPPRRPASARPGTVAPFRPPPPPQTPARRTSMFYDDDRDEDALFGDLSPSPLAPYDYGSPLAYRPKMPTSGLADVAYDAHDYRTEVAGRNHRRNSYYGDHSASSGSGYEEQVRVATRYQEDLMGGSPLPLTAETLRKARNGGSSRSSGSHDESDYRQSATTRTTHTNPNEEDVTIRVKGSTVLKVGGAEMQCFDGAEINISKNGAATFRGGSDKSSYIDNYDDRRTRVDMPVGRARGMSRARSYSRTYPNLDNYGEDPEYEYVGTEYAPTQVPPPYPAYPSYSSSYSRQDEGLYGYPPR